jgi:hypothetical protein
MQLDIKQFLPNVSYISYFCGKDIDISDDTGISVTPRKMPILHCGNGFLLLVLE